MHLSRKLLHTWITDDGECDCKGDADATFIYHHQMTAGVNMCFKKKLFLAVVSKLCILLYTLIVSNNASKQRIHVF